MFKSIRYLNSTTDIIVDDDFEQPSVILSHDNYQIKLVIDASVIIRVYEAKNLNVPANLVLYFKYIASIYQSLPVQNQIEWNSKYNNLYKPYATEIEKYFILL